MFGCGQNNTGSFIENDTGVIGLGNGSNSSISQDSTYYYFVALYGVGVLGDQYLPFKSSRPVSTRNMFLDSGQPPTTAHFDTPRTAREIGS
ncbi:hypothetical protein CDL15_Pgr016791 [Punica granatum]|uniref:Xylanase inhibitor N-terminal domain-containing protein n=1 Tax=Punica granatum TaxID=22663 RepID=A0A218WXG2_PUNGR|nr:hypothetical protein CDL15_Pgr016791 [Punica granatum]